MSGRFKDRREAGRVLAERLRHLVGRQDLLVLALPRGGVPVAYEVAEALGAPLDLIIVRKLGVPGHEELAMGAIASGGVLVLNDDVVRHADISQATIDRVAAAEGAELHRRERAYRGDRAPVGVAARHVILIDDGLATGATMRAAARAVRAQGPASITVAVPVAAAPSCEEFRGFRHEVDEVVCAMTPEPFYSVGLWYEDFAQTDDDEVHELLERAWHDHPVR